VWPTTHTDYFGALSLTLSETLSDTRFSFVGYVQQSLFVSLVSVLYIYIYIYITMYITTVVYYTYILSSCCGGGGWKLEGGCGRAMSCVHAFTFVVVLVQ
jgi:hypothetical protein